MLAGRWEGNLHGAASGIQLLRRDLQFISAVDTLDDGQG